MRATRSSALAVGGGITAGIFIVVAALGGLPTPAGPDTIIPADSSVTIDAYHNASNATNFVCYQRCGSPGEQSFRFSVEHFARLSGTLRFGAPVDVWVANGVGMTAACSLSTPQPPCHPPPVGPSYLYQSRSAVSTIDFGQLSFDFGGIGNALPAGSWTVLLINPSDRPVTATADSAVVATPTW
jgi:hypothetical protein